MALKFTEATTDDREPVMDLTAQICGKLFGDKGYISKTLKENLMAKGVELITKVRKNMKKLPLPDFDRLMLRKRAIVESVIDQLKNISQIEHTRHRSINNFLLNIIAGLTAYSLQEKKPAIALQCQGLTLV